MQEGGGKWLVDQMIKGETGGRSGGIGEGKEEEWASGRPRLLAQELSPATREGGGSCSPVSGSALPDSDKIRCVQGGMAVDLSHIQKL